MRYSFDHVASIRRNCSWDVYRNGVFQACVCTSELEEKGAEKLVAEQPGKSFAFLFHGVSFSLPMFCIHLVREGTKLWPLMSRTSLPCFAFEGAESRCEITSQPAQCWSRGRVLSD